MCHPLVNLISLSFCVVGSDQLTIDNLSEVYNAVYETRMMWREIGIQLNVAIGTLDAIAEDEKKADGCLQKMLQKWLENGKDRSWKVLAEALRNKTVGHTVLADKLPKYRCTTK